MKVLFVNPPRHDGLPVIREDRCEIVNRYLINPPYSLIQMASVLRERVRKPKTFRTVWDSPECGVGGCVEKET